MTTPAAYTTDPRWQAAYAEHLRDLGPDETPSEAVIRRIGAALAMCEIEMEHE